MVKILDCTTRDGGHTNNWEFEDKYIINLIHTLNEFSVQYYEIGYRNHFDIENKGKFYNCTPRILKNFYDIKQNLKLGVMTDTNRYSTDDFQNANADYIDFVRVACHPEQINLTLNIAKSLHDKGYKVFIQLMDISNIDEAGYIQLLQWEHKNILESIYIADSYGTLVPRDIEHYYNKLKILGYRKISFHGHNNNGMALKNSLKAIELGAYSIDTTQNGIGRNGGNLNLYDLQQVINK